MDDACHPDPHSDFFFAGNRRFFKIVAEGECFGEERVGNEQWKYSHFNEQMGSLYLLIGIRLSTIMNTYAWR